MKILEWFGQKKFRVRRRYRVEFVGKRYKNLEGPKVIYVDPQNVNEVYYMINVYIDDPGVKITIEYNDNTERVMKRSWSLPTPRKWRI